MQSEKFEKLVFSHLLERQTALKSDRRLVHYTSAASACRIIAGGQVWLRNAQLMNDFSEIQHGLNCLNKAWASPAGTRLQSMLDRLRPGLRDKLAMQFDGHTNNLKLETYIFSLSEHEDDEDELGRLSMWRAYGGCAGVALVLNNTAFVSETDEMNVFSSPVFYHDPASFEKWFQDWADGITNAKVDLKTLNTDEVCDLLFVAFRSFVLCTKHPAFSEEKEWRVFYSPVHEGTSEWIEDGVEIVNGTPEILMKFKLRDNPDQGVTGVALSTLINRVIIGPCENPIQVRAAIASTMENAGIENPLDKIWMSLIPLRN